MRKMRLHIPYILLRKSLLRNDVLIQERIPGLRDSVKSSGYSRVSSFFTVKTKINLKY